MAAVETVTCASTRRSLRWHSLLADAITTAPESSAAYLVPAPASSAEPAPVAAQVAESDCLHGSLPGTYLLHCTDVHCICEPSQHCADPLRYAQTADAMLNDMHQSLPPPPRKVVYLFAAKPQVCWNRLRMPYSTTCQIIPKGQAQETSVDQMRAGAAARIVLWQIFPGGIGINSSV